MPIILRILLFLASVGTFVFVLQKIRKSQMKIEDSIFWILLSIVILGMSIFPNIIFEVSYRLNIESPTNFVYLVFIFVLLIKVFSMSIKISQLENRIKNLAQKIAIDETIRNEEKK